MQNQELPKLADFISNILNNILATHETVNKWKKEV